jgi:hypothetical protein
MERIKTGIDKDQINYISLSALDASMVERPKIKRRQYVGTAFFVEIFIFGFRLASLVHLIVISFFYRTIIESHAKEVSNTVPVTLKKCEKQATRYGFHMSQLASACN